jgi:hypothetical protein
VLWFSNYKHKEEQDVYDETMLTSSRFSYGGIELGAMKYYWTFGHVASSINRFHIKAICYYGWWLPLQWLLNIFPLQK